MGESSEERTVVTRNWPTVFLLLSVGLFVSGCGTSEDRVVAGVWKHPRLSKFHAAFPEAKLEVQLTSSRGFRARGEFRQFYNYEFSSHADLAEGYELHVRGTARAAPAGIPGPTKISSQEWCLRTPEGKEVGLSRSDMGTTSLELLLESGGDLTVVNVGHVDVVDRSLSAMNEVTVIDAIRKSDARIRQLDEVFSSTRAGVSKPRYKTRGTFRLDVHLGHDYRLVAIRTVRVAPDGETVTLVGDTHYSMQKGKEFKYFPEERLDQLLRSRGDPVVVGRLWDMLRSDDDVVKVQKPLPQK
jgi:hypothetical protein